MSWQEFCTLLAGIMPDTPLGQIVSIRAEKDPKVIKNFTKEQKRIRREWMHRKQNNGSREQSFTEKLLGMQETLKKMFS